VQYFPHERITQQDADSSTRPKQLPDSAFTINHVGIHVPHFWPKKPDVWFAQLEGQFALSNITQDATKFYYIISQLDDKYAAEVQDVITNLPPTGRYDRIKAELIRRLSLSEELRVRQSMCTCAHVHTYVRACVRVRVRVCVWGVIYTYITTGSCSPPWIVLVVAVSGFRSLMLNKN
jgi:hypothetical protein